MKKSIYILSLLISLLSSCVNRGQPVLVETAGEGYDYEVVKLFTVDGITVYRFVDGGRQYHYFTNRNGQSLNMVSDGETTREETIDNYGK